MKDIPLLGWLALGFILFGVLGAFTGTSYRYSPGDYYIGCSGITRVGDC